MLTKINNLSVKLNYNYIKISQLDKVKMAHNYSTRYQAKVNGNGSPDPFQDKYLKYDSTGSISSDDEDSDDLSSIDSDSECSEEMFSDDSDNSEDDVDLDESEARSHIKNIIKNALMPKHKESKSKRDVNSEETGGKVINLFLGEDDMEEEEEEEENFLDTLTPEEKKSFLKLENQISKINHKRVPLRYQILRSHLPIEIKAAAIKRLESIQKMDETSTEYHKMSGWIDGLLNIPFNHFVDNKISLETSKPEEITDYLVNVKDKLDASVHGHVEAKSTLLEIVASWITNPTATPTVIGLQGPPGTGKTTLIKDGVAKALGRPFSMFALGGATDASYLEGHSYTYEGSTWGRLAAILMETKCMNPVIFMDELDKVSETKHGEEIIGVLTHLIDYSQNNCIQDKYFSGIPLDFSKVLFIFSFNSEEKLNPILKDRIHIIHTDSCTRESKQVIARDYLIPKILANVKFKKDDIIFPDETVREIIDRYTDSESGVRNLKRCLESVIMKLNTLRLTSQNSTIVNSPNSQLIPYFLNNYKLPMTITSTVVDKLIGKTSLATKGNEKHLMMYL
jgi:ATP-dependent Lon protease